MAKAKSNALPLPTPCFTSPLVGEVDTRSVAGEGCFYRPLEAPLIRCCAATSPARREVTNPPLLLLDITPHTFHNLLAF